MPAARKPKPQQPFTVEHFKRYSGHVMLDTGEFFVAEPFQLEVVKPILAGTKEVWAILPEGNAKTTLMALYALYHCDYTVSPWVPIAASSRDQAEIMARQAYEMIRHSPGMTDRFRIYEGYREIRSRRNGGRGIKVYAADKITADGVIPTLAMCDEGHRMPDMGLYRLWRGKLGKRNGQIVMVSTAGEPGSEFEEARDRIRDRATKRTVRGAHIHCVGSGLVMNEWKLADSRQASDIRKVKQANPLKSITVTTLTEEFKSPTMDLGDWLRLKCNIPARSSNVAITDAEWDAAYVDDEIPAGDHVDLGIDVAWKHDTFAMAPLWEGPDYFLLGAPAILTPPRDGSMLHPDEVKVAFEKIHKRNPVDVAVMDMERGEDIASWLETEHGVVVIDRSAQGTALAAEDYESFMEGLRSDMLKHTGHSGLRAHVLHAIARSLPGDKRRFDRPSQSRARKKQEQRVIDALTAAAMVYHFATHRPEEPEHGLVGEVDDYRISMVA